MVSKSNPDLKKLQALVPMLGEFKVDQNLPGSPSNSNVLVDYNVDGGTCFGIKSYYDNQKRIASMRVFMSKGSVFERHVHQEAEVIIVFAGEMIMYDDDIKKGKKYYPGDEPFYAKPMQAHACKAIEDTWLYCITVPAGDGYAK